MNLKRIGTLLGKEFLTGPKNFIFIWAVIAPLLISLLLSLVFGSLFADKPKLGLADEGSSRFTTAIYQLDSVITREYDSDIEIRQAVENGSVDMGLVVPADFDSTITGGQEIGLTVYVWGESLAKNRTILGITLVDLIREMAGHESPIEIENITLGDEVSIPWGDRLLPLVVLMAVCFSGIMIPSALIINEKENKTLEALVITPTSMTDVLVSKGVTGIIFSLINGVLILLINQAFGAQPLLLTMVLVLGAVMASEIGLILGILLKNITNMLAVWKSGGILLFGPAIVYMFPQIPAWVGRLFPTYYLIQPVVEISQQGGGWPDIALNVFILIGFDIILAAVVGITLKRSRQFAT